MDWSVSSTRPDPADVNLHGPLSGGKSATKAARAFGQATSGTELMEKVYKAGSL